MDLLIEIICGCIDSYFLILQGVLLVGGHILPTTMKPAFPKPVFLTKAQREQQALQRRSNQVAANHKQELLLRPSDPKPSDSDRRSYRERDRERERDRDNRDRERRNRDREREEEDKDRKRARLEKLAEQEREKELESIKEQYLGSKKPKKRVIKPSEKF